MLLVHMNLITSPSQLFDFLGRAFVAALFVNAIPGKLSGFSGTVGFITSKGIPWSLASFLLVCAIFCLTLGSLLFVFNSNTRLGASFLLVFLVPTTLIFHTFPLDNGFLRNLCVIGALILSITRSTGGAVPSFRNLRG